MTKIKRYFTHIRTRLLTVSSARLSTILPIALLTIFLSFSPSATMQATERDSLNTFQFVSKRGMFYVPYKENGEELERLLVLIRQHQKDILAGNIPVFVNGFCNSALTDRENLRLARERSNRIKTEMILRGGLREECFHTTNVSGPYGEQQNTVIVRIVLPENTTTSGLQAKSQLGDTKVELDDAKVEVYDTNIDLYDSQVDLSNRHSEGSEESSFPTPATYPSVRGWSIGLNLGVPFFWGDMLSMSADKTYIGFGAGIQGSYRFSRLLGLTLSADYARGKTGARDYASNYQLAPSGMTLYADGTDTSLPYGELYSKISVVNAGLGLDIHLNRLFSRSAVSSRFQAVLTPTVYGQFFSADVYNKVNNTKFSDGTTKPNTISIGLGGALSLQYHLTSSLGIQLKNSLIWITDNQFDGVVTPYNHTRHNAMWLSQAGIIWYFLHK